MMFGAQFRCKGCNQYAPDRCTCGESITDAAVKAQMAAARASFEAELIGVHGAPILAGSPHYEIGFVARDWRTFWRIWNLATSHNAANSQPAVPAIPDALLEISRQLHLQDNCGTVAPLFLVQQKIAYVTEEGYNDSRSEWRETRSGEYREASALRAERLEALCQRGRDIDGWKRFSVFDKWEFVTACFTRQGCEDYLDLNRHNLGETRIFAETSFRNEEYLTIREWLMSLTPAPTKETN